MNQRIKSDLLDSNGKKIGTVYITQKSDGTLIYDEISIDDPEMLQKVLIGEDKPMSIGFKVKK